VPEQKGSVDISEKCDNIDILFCANKNKYDGQRDKTTKKQSPPEPQLHMHKGQHCSLILKFQDHGHWTNVWNGVPVYSPAYACSELYCLVT